MADDLIGFLDNRRKDRVLVRMTRSTNPGAVVAMLSQPLDGRLSQVDGYLRPLGRMRSDVLISVPVPPGKTKASVRAAIRKAAIRFAGPRTISGRISTAAPNVTAAPSSDAPASVVRPGHVIGRMSSHTSARKPFRRD